METRRRLLMVANAFLYFGPLLAGLAGLGWGYVVLFTAIFVLWLIILQPYEFPINRAEWMTPDAWVAVAARAAVQLLFVVILFGIGRGIGGILGAMTGFPATLPIAVSFLSIPLARMIWDPWLQRTAPPSSADQKDPPAAMVAKAAPLPDSGTSGTTGTTGTRSP